MRNLANLLYIGLIFCGFTSCCEHEKKLSIPSNSTTKNNDVKTYMQKAICFHNDSCDVGCITLSADTVIPNYYIEYNDKKYRLDSYLYNQRNPSFWYDIFENKHKSFSFVLFFGEKQDAFGNKTDDGIYHYTFLDIEKNKHISTSTYCEIYEIPHCQDDYKIYEPSSGKWLKYECKKNDDDTIAILKRVKNYRFSADEYFSKDITFPRMDTVQSVNYMLRNGIWTKKPQDNEEDLVMKHFAFVL